MSMTDTTPIAAAALLVLEAEMKYTDAIAHRGYAPAGLGTPAALLAAWEAAQADYEAEILLRTTPTGALSPAPV